MWADGGTTYRVWSAVAATALLAATVVRALDNAATGIVPVWLDVGVSLSFIAAGLALVRRPTVGGNGWLLVATGWLLLPRTLVGSPDSTPFTIAIVLEIAWLGPLVHFMLTGTAPLRGRRIATTTVVLTYLHVTALRVLDIMYHFRREQPDIPENQLKVAGRHPEFDWVDPAAANLPAILGCLALVALVDQFRLSSPSVRLRWLPINVAALVLIAVLISNPLVAQVGDRALLDLLLYAEELALLFLALACLAVVASELLAHRMLIEVAAAVGAGDDLTPAIRSALRDPSAVVVETVDMTPAPGRFCVPLEASGTTVGALIVDDHTRSDPMLRPVAGFVAVAVANERLARRVQTQLKEVQRSRARLVVVADSERRRIERDLHDGVQQLLLAVGMELSLTQVAARREGAAEATARLAMARSHLQEATDELRRLARGLMPSALADYGLHAAIMQIAERSSVPVRTVYNVDRRLPAVVETTAYFVVAEALTNVTRHARATNVTVAIDDNGTTIGVVVADDGCGGASTSGGSGLVGLQDRVAALGGTIEMTSPSELGTTIVATMPLNGT